MVYHRRIQRDLEAGIPVWAPKFGAQKDFLVQYFLSSIHSNKNIRQLSWMSHGVMGF